MSVETEVASPLRNFVPSHNEPEARPAPRASMAMLVQNFHLGGTEQQAVELFTRLSSRWDASLACVSKAGPHLSRVRERGVEPLELPLRGSMIRANTALQIWRLAQQLRARRIRLVHAHDFYTTLLAVPAAKLAGAKVIVGRLDMGHWPTGLARRALIAATRAADGVIANAEAIREQLVHEEQIAPDRIEVIPNGIDLANFDARAAAPLSDALPARPGVKPLVHVANMTHPVKAQEDLFRALQILRFDRPELALWLVGTGARRPQLEALAIQLGIGDRVHFLGHRLDVAAILKRAYAGVLCSHNEGLSNALIEYLAAGLPAIATNVGGNPELVAHGIRGLLVPARAPHALAAAIDRLLECPELAQRFGANGRAFVQRELTIEQLVARHEALYAEILSRP